MAHSRNHLDSPQDPQDAPDKTMNETKHSSADVIAFGTRSNPLAGLHPGAPIVQQRSIL